MLYVTIALDEFQGSELFALFSIPIILEDIDVALTDLYLYYKVSQLHFLLCEKTGKELYQSNFTFL
ncbi:hypothetical protein J2S19_002871 [Metabacillus malikii]|uniref:Uncharacterized protein n=1 Tax=Metabacillus malikii TaxID=1504265 RepID=A0ABT9ZJ73_9BACI|nr:hypothetical protein [Metabacillus malikii]